MIRAASFMSERVAIPIPESTSASGMFGVRTKASGTSSAISVFFASSRISDIPPLATITGSTTSFSIAILADLPGDDADHLGGGQHPGLGRVDPDVGRHRVELGGDELRRYLVDAVDPEGILGGQRRNDAHPETAENGDRLQIRLDSRPAAGIGTGNRQYPDRHHLFTSPGKTPGRKYLTARRRPESTSTIPWSPRRRLLTP